ncbi:MAG: hypothetical protein HFH15_04750 [Ruminococcus sp.]|jgi:precorrin-3B methylase|nr:hypothetical protein [Ruminococcus sp.]
MQQTINRTGKESVISMEEYLRRKNVIRGKELEDANSGDEIHRREKSEKKAEDPKKVNAVKWGAMMELAAMLYV